MQSLAELATRIEQGTPVVAGVLSGTSADGIDVALARIGREGEDLAPPELLAFETRAFPADLGARVRAVLDGEGLGVREVALLGRDLGSAFGEAARAVADGAGLGLDLVGSHGQTVWHHDGTERAGPASLQLGDGDHVAAAARSFVVSDFRQGDLAAGGEGAPLSALVDGLLFRSLERPVAILNLGGMANLTLLGERRLVAFDTGPAGALLDGLARRLLGRPLDGGGRAAGAGEASPALLSELLRHPFLRRSPPKSTGRDTFGEAWVGGVVARARELGVVSPRDVLRTAVELVAATVADGLARFADPATRHLVVAGGGVENAALLEALGRRCRAEVATSAAFGVDPDAREALVFAVLAARAVLGLPSTDPGATGARPGRVLGKLSPPPLPPR